MIYWKTRRFNLKFPSRENNTTHGNISILPRYSQCLTRYMLHNKFLESTKCQLLSKNSYLEMLDTYSIAGICKTVRYWNVIYMTCSRYGWNNTGSLAALWPIHIAVANIFKGLKHHATTIGACRPGHTRALPGLFQIMRTHITRTGCEDPLYSVLTHAHPHV